MRFAQPASHSPCATPRSEVSTSPILKLSPTCSWCQSGPADHGGHDRSGHDGHAANCMQVLLAVAYASVVCWTDANLRLDGLTDGPSSRSNSGMANGHLKRHASHASIGSSPLAKPPKKRKNTGLKVKFSNPR